MHHFSRCFLHPPITEGFNSLEEKAPKCGALVRAGAAGGMLPLRIPLAISASGIKLQDLESSCEFV